MTNQRCLECELSRAASDGDLEALREALREGAAPGSDSDCNTALFNAIERGLVDIFTTLLDAGADSLRRHPLTNQTPFMATLEGEQLEMIQELKRRGVDPSSASLPSLVHGEDRPELVRLALAGGVDLNSADPETGRTALHMAATYGYLRTVKCLAEEGADASIHDHWGNTPATLATRNHHGEIARLLTGLSQQTETAE